MAANFKHLLAIPAFKAEKPKPLPAGDYPGKVAKWEQGESAQKKTPYVRFYIALTGWPDSVSEEDRVFVSNDGSTKPIDLSKKQQKIDFYLTEGSLHRLDEFLKSIGLEGQYATYEEAVPAAVGADVLVEVRQETNDRGDEAVTYNKVDKVVGQGA